MLFRWCAITLACFGFALSCTAPAQTAVAAPGAIDAAAMPGGELGEQVRNALQALKGTCGTVSIANGTYQWQTPVTMLPCQTITGNGSVVRVGPMGGPFLTIQAPQPTGPATAATLTPGGVNNITIEGPGPNEDVEGTHWTRALRAQAGIFIGGVDSTHFAAVGSFSGLHMRHFGSPVSYGNGFQTVYLGGVFEDNFDGLTFPGANGVENINLHGTQILNNVRYGINSGCHGANTEIDLFGVSLDYNGQVYKENGVSAGGQVHMCGGALNVYGGHMESRQTPFIRFDEGGVLAIHQGSMVLVADAGPDPVESYIVLNGVNNRVDIDGLGTAETSFTSRFPHVPSLINFNVGGADSHLFVHDYAHGLNGNMTTLPILKPGQTPNFYGYPMLNAAGDTVGVVTNQRFAPLLADRFIVDQGVGAGTGLQHGRFAAGCSASGAAGATCQTPPLRFAMPFPDDRYTLTCSLSSPTGHPVISSIVKQADGKTFQANIATLNGAPASGTLECVAFHD